ncbi:MULTISPECIES: N-acetylmuramate alpha-1-phosphate uridylyltransferase MurU [unclassified Undibacterium]|uniref:N-acetylmuramate alpha-1-phosphate uridylyltransferase MurU n=1 Tax=unclassified Undibacterium TaxID=2630295 RepID=UPI002AC8B53B|nr:MULTISPECIES: nucleotidyltransferase family protein [unclassified Undibacterium]MEB0139253.1 nucleotidyltransferase family protein [Undibacterium sp. CCC2.1]MEB0172097.1 nucleotidyltransferase family protein [Undibacterium sp. CCC1.1]MEB0175972.1 nucleotidyltransferase family protein [Undibacterium sp. CCC3.4]MEB0215284.1 nucleotidyltransferase family protein [Undibacterium sp. 5I2]WPX45458.1 nucleotidyltransferase family protein [Undibacterium sp. CCC3.4]
MKAMLLAAGRGERMRPLTDTCPKPLLKVRGRPLIVWHILNLVKAGIHDIVINHAHLGAMLEDSLGDGSQFGARLQYSPETTALETAGGIAQALPLLGNAAFLVVSADIYIPHFDFRACLNTLEENDPWGTPLAAETRDLAWLYMVKNPPFHPHGDFALSLMGLSNHKEDRHTFANIGVYRPELFASIEAGSHAKLGPLLTQHIESGRIGGELYRGIWHNVGTPEQLAALNAPLKLNQDS